MKTFSPRNCRCNCNSRARRSEKGFVVIALMAILAIMLIYINVNMQVLYNLKRDLRLIEQKQIQRLEKVGVQTLRFSNAVTNSAPAPVTNSIAQ